MLHLSKFIWTLRSSVGVVYNNFLLIDATDRSKFSSDQKRFLKNKNIEKFKKSNLNRTVKKILKVLLKI